MRTYNSGLVLRDLETKIDRQGQRILDESRLEGQEKPRVQLIEKILVYITRIKERFPGSTLLVSSAPSFKRFTVDDDVFEGLKFAELTFVRYSGHFALGLLRDEFPKDFFIMETTEQGPRLLCTQYADKYLVDNSFKVRGSFFTESCPTDPELERSLQLYREKCCADSTVSDIVKIV